MSRKSVNGHYQQTPALERGQIVLCRALLFAMTRRMRSSRAIEYNINHSIDFMWLVSGRNIDHTTLSE